MSLSDLIKGAKVTFSCPNCQENITQQLGRLNADNKLSCPACGRIIRVDGGETVNKAGKKADKASADFKRDIGKLSDE